MPTSDVLIFLCIIPPFSHGKGRANMQLHHIRPQMYRCCLARGNLQSVLADPDNRLHVSALRFLQYDIRPGMRHACCNPACPGNPYLAQGDLAEPLAQLDAGLRECEAEHAACRLDRAHLAAASAEPSAAHGQDQGEGTSGGGDAPPVAAGPARGAPPRDEEAVFAFLLADVLVRLSQVLPSGIKTCSCEKCKPVRGIRSIETPKLLSLLLSELVAVPACMRG